MIGLQLPDSFGNLKFVGCEPFPPYKAYANRANLGSWEALRFVSHGNKYGVEFIQANHALSDTPNGPESRPLGTFGAWEEFRFDNNALALTGPYHTYTVVGWTQTFAMPRIQGRDFVDKDGKRRVLRGIDQFWAYRLWLDGRTDDLANLVQESVALGFDMWRVFGMGSKRQNTVFDLSPSEPRYYERLRAFVEWCNLHGILVLFTVFADAQDVMPVYEHRQTHWMACAERLRGTGVIFSYGNERDKNGTEHDQMTDPGLLWSRGSWTQDPDPFKPLPEGASFAEYHPRRDLWASLFDTVASPVTIWTRDGVGVPLVCDEPPRFGTNGSGEAFEDPNLAWKFFRHYATEFAAVVFHNYFSQRCLLMDPLTRACAEQAVRGMRT
jgi:hypothetical protein